mmetsp:Transcript_40864/g.91679  ORF Transcript_40864/g.91679 Transcript_40864/m.91679 type:complete len:680 (+) Transcript_40864:35-2074(+)
MQSLELRFSPEVAQAQQLGQAVVALESTIISHGMPYPQNVECAREVESTIRTLGAIPATIGIINGIIHVGMTDEELTLFGQTPCEKVSRRDLANAVGMKLNGATTVAATMLIAHMAGILVFVTGGIGGVHRGAEESWDVSADLTELGRTPVAVVCAGAKSILDIPKTLEYLETQGVVVIGLRTSTFPAFFTPSSGLPVPCSCATEEDVAKVIAAQTRLGLTSGLVIGNPIQQELAAEVATIEKATEQAVSEAAEQRVTGRDATPFLLRRINELTGGESLRVNIELIKNNARAGAKIAVSLSELKRRDSIGLSPSSSSTLSLPKRPKLAVIGGTVLDYTAKPLEKRRFGEFGTMKTSVPGTMRTSVGGVGRTIAESIHRLAGRSSSPEWMFESVLGEDAVGRQLAESCAEFPALLHHVPRQSSATYTAMLDGLGELVTAIADMAVFDAWPPLSTAALSSGLLVLDTNVPQHILESACTTNMEVWVEPVSVAKARRITSCLSRLSLVTPNIDELRAMVEALGDPWVEVDSSTADALERTLPQAVEPLLARGTRHVLVTCGRLGAVLCAAQPAPAGTASAEQRYVYADPAFTVTQRQWQHTTRRFLHYAVPPLNDVESVTGAGDSLVAGAAWAYGLKGVSIEDSVLYGLAASRLCLAALESVSPVLSPDLITPTSSSQRSRL